MESTDLFPALSKRVSDFPDQLILIVIKGRYPFITNLAGLDLSGCISVLLFNSKNSDQLSIDQSGRFDFVQYFDAGEFWKGDTMAHVDGLEFPELVGCVETMMGRMKPSPGFNMERVRLVAMEEHFVRVVANLRERYGIPGAKPDDITRFTDKRQMKDAASQGGVSTAKYVIVRPQDLKNNQAAKDDLERVIGYPIMVKPLHGAGTAGIEKINNRTRLDTWISDHPEPQMEYLAEEFIIGDEHHMLVLVQKSNIQVFPVPLTFIDLSDLECMRRNIPMCTSSEKDPAKWAIMEEFARHTATVFQPPENGLLFIQTFMTSDGKMKLIELAYRVPGKIGSITFQENSGISPESVQIMAPVKIIDFNKLTAFGGKERKHHFANVTYPTKDGVVKKIQQVPDGSLKSDLKVTYAVKVGDRTSKAGDVSSMAVRMFLWNDDYDDLRRDCQWLRNSFIAILMDNE